MTNRLLESVVQYMNAHKSKKSYATELTCVILYSCCHGDCHRCIQTLYKTTVVIKTTQ